MSFSETAKALRANIIVRIHNMRKGNTASNLGFADVMLALIKQTKENDQLYVTPNLKPALLATQKILNKHSTNETFAMAASVGAGSSLACKQNKQKRETYCILGDCEHTLGHTYETMMFSKKHNLNITFVVNDNNIQADGYTNQTSGIDSVANKYRSANIKTIEVDGHNSAHIEHALNELRLTSGPKALICHTTSGKGVNFLENKANFRKPLTKEQAKLALDYLHA